MSETVHKKPHKKIRRRDVFRVFLRSFFVQSVWNYRSLISAGFGICLIPIVKRLYDDPKSYQAFLNRHLKFFNAHPYMASYALGVSICLEEANAAGDPDASKKLDRLKNLLVTILGAVGDKLFWSAIKPFSLILGITLLFIFQDPVHQVLALVLVFLIYNIPHIYLRYIGIWEGYRYGLEIYKRLGDDRFRKLRRAYSFMGVAAFTVFLGALAIHLLSINLTYMMILLISAAVVSFIRRFSLNFYLTVLVSFGVCLALGFLLV